MNEWIDLILRTIITAFVTYLTTKYAITKTERVHKKVRYHIKKGVKRWKS